MAKPTLAVVLPALALSAMAINPGATMAAVACFTLLLLLLWRSSEPPVLFFVAAMMWLQGALAIFHADVLGTPLWKMSYARGYEDACILTMAWVAVFAVGMRLVMSGCPAIPLGQESGFELTRRQALVAYLGWTLAVTLLERVMVGGLRQVLIALAHLRWAMVFALFWLVVRERRGFPLLLLVFGFEVLTGFLSFFADFKTPIYILLLAFAATDYRLRVRQVLAVGVLGVGAVYLAILWSAIKMEYRDVLNQGSGAQVVTISRSEQIEALADLVTSADEEVMARGLDAFVKRLSYVEYFGYVAAYVPRLAPYAGGELHLAALRHILMPRLLFPNKPALVSDTLVTERYTGLHLTQYGRATSISVGLPAEGYIDFGPWGMFGSALLLGMLAAWPYRYFARMRTHRVLALSVGTAVMLPLSTLEAATVKFVGGQVTHFLVAILLWKFVLPPLVRALGGARVAPRQAGHARSVRRLVTRAYPRPPGPPRIR